MSERRPWTQQEDTILQRLFEVDGVKKWSQISRLMEQHHNIVGRNGKQCRQRYHNHLKDGIKREKWTAEEEQLLVSLHAQFGNRWSHISKLIEGRPQNCVKNMLYSKMRKSVRQLNRFSYLYFKRVLKQIKLSFVNRLIDITETAYKKVEEERSQTENTAISIKNQILRLTFDQNEELQQEEKNNVRKLIEEIHIFKKDNQKYHRGVTLTKIKKQKMKKKESWEINSQDDMFNYEDQMIEEEIQSSKEVKIEAEEQIPLASKNIERKDTNSTENGKKSENIVKKGVIMSESSCDTPKQINFQDPRPKVEVLKPDTFGEDFLSLMQDNDLNRPIQTEEPFGLSPSPYYRDQQMSWISSQQMWKNYQL